MAGTKKKETAVPNERENVLYVKFFGEFSVRWNNKTIIGGSRANSSQNGRLLQMLLFHGADGVPRQSLEEYVFEGRDIDDIPHATQSVIYNTKKKLKSSGLPDDAYVSLQNNRFFWSSNVEIVCDTEVFRSLYERAAEAEDLDEKLRLYLDAVYTYTGDFLPLQQSQLWIAQNLRDFHEMFCSAINNAVVLLRINQDWETMQALGLYAAKTDPLADWEIITMEALTELERSDEAMVFYQETTDYYLREQGLRPSRKLVEMVERLGSQMKHSFAVLDTIQAELSGSEETEPGGFLCPYPVFRGIYRMIERMIERSGQSIYLMLCTVVDTKGAPMREGPVLDDLSTRLGEAIRLSIRHSDAICRYGGGQYLVLLVNTTRENCDVVQKRINQRFIIGHQRTGIDYYVKSVICEPDSLSSESAGQTEAAKK